jgi:type VI secretion system protein ImpB
MDGKTGAEALIARLLEEPALMQALSAQPRPEAQATETQTPTEGA